MNFQPTVHDIKTSYFGRTWFFSSYNDDCFCYTLIKNGKRHELFFTIFDGEMLQNQMITEELLDVIYEIQDYNYFELGV